MAFIPFEDTVEVNVNYTFWNNQCQNTLYFSNGSGVEIANMITLAEAIAGALIADVMLNMPNSLVLREVTVTDLSSDSAPSYTSTAGLPNTGAVTTDVAMPGGSTLAISFRTAGRGRSSRGRNYLLGLRRSQVTGNTVAQSFVDLWNPFYEALLDGSLTGDYIWVAASRYHNELPRALGVVNPITAYLVTDLELDSQRRRLNGRGT